MSTTTVPLSKSFLNLRAGILLAASFALLPPCATQGQSAFSNAVMSLNPVAYWPLQETVQPPAASFEPNLGSLGSAANIYYSSVPNTGNPQLFAMYPGALSNENNSTPGMFFNGNASAFGLVPTTDNRVSLPPGRPFSVELWVQPYTLGQYQGIVCQTGNLGPGGNNAAGYKAGWNFNQNYVPLADDGSGTQSGFTYGWSFAVYNGNTSFSGAQAIAPYPYLTGTSPSSQIAIWYHLVGVFDGTNCSIYVNGVRASAPDYDIPMPAGTSFLPDTWDPIQFATSRVINANLWKGGMEEVAIYTNALTPQQIFNHYSIGTNSSLPGGTYANQVQNIDNAYMYWRMTAGANFYSDPSSGSFPQAGNFGTLSASTVNSDDGGSGYNAIYEPGTLPGMPGPSYAGFGSPSYACAFNGIDGMVDAGYVGSLNPTAASNFTVVAWFKGNPCDNNGRWNSIASHSDKSWRMKVNNGSLVWDAGVGTDLHAPAVNINDGNWHMFTGVWNTSTSTETVSIDAGAFSSATVTNPVITGASTTNVVLGCAPDYCEPNYFSYSGYKTNYNGSQQYLAGMLAHVAFFPTALTAAQISGLYSASGAPPMIQIQPISSAGVLSGGSTNVFTVTASGSTNGLVYQWYLTNASGTAALVDNSVSVTGSASNILTLTNLADSESGSYYLVVSNSFGVVTSAMATLQVSSQPYIVSQTGGGPLPLFANQGYTLSVTAVGAAPLTYQWYINGVADTIAGTNSTYGISGAQTSMTGTTYYCVVSNGVSTATSLTTTLAVSALPASLTSSTYGSAMLSLNPTGYWPMHEAAAGVQGDIETNLGTLGAAGTAWYGDWDINFSNPSNVVQLERGVQGALANDPDPGLRFDRGQACDLIVPHTSPQTTLRPPFSLEIWANPQANIGTQVLIGQGGGQGLSGVGNPSGVDLEYSGPSTTNSFALTLYNGSGHTTISSGPVYPEGHWYYVVATYDGTNAAIYVNGSLVANNTSSMAIDYWSPLSIGMGLWAGNGGANPFSGALDEPVVYTNVLTAAMVANHYSTALTGASGAYKTAVLAQNPLLYYRLDAPAYVKPPQSTWPVMYNYGTNALNGYYTPGTVPGSSPVALSGVSSPVAYTGNGMGAFAVAGQSPYFNPLGFTSFSYTAFFRAYPTDGRTWQDIMSGNDADLRCSLQGSTGKVVGHGTQDQTTPLGIYNDGNWHQVVVTAQAAAGGGFMTNLTYVDGVLQVTNNTTSTNNPASDPGPILQMGNENGYSITNNQSGNLAGERCLTGSICEAAFFYGQVLSSQQVSNLYSAAGVAPFFPFVANVAPGFVNVPVVTNVNEGSSFTFSFGAATGSGSSISYQWYSNGVAMAGQTNVALTINPVLLSSAASYYNVASSAYGSGTSQILQVTVASTPVIASVLPATSLIEILGSSTINFSVVATGATPLHYIWSSNGVIVASATNASFSLTNASVANDGTYDVVVSNFLGAASNVWQVSVVPVSGGFVPAVVALQPYGFWLMNEPGDGQSYTNFGVCHDYVSGNNGQYENAITGAPGFNFDDFFTGFYDTNTSASFGPQQNSCALNISNVVVSSPTSGEFTVQCWAQCPAPISDAINTPNLVSKGLYSHEEFALDLGTHVGNYTAYRFSIRNTAETQIDAGSAVVAGSDTNWHFIVGVCDQVHSNSLLYIDGTNAARATILPGAGLDNAGDSIPVMIGSRTSTTYDPSQMNEQFTGQIADVAIFKYALTSNQVLSEYLAAGIAPQITLQPPASTNISAGTNLVVNAAAVGSGSLNYQWLDVNSNSVIGQTNAILSIATQPTNNTYFLQVSNIYGTNYSSNIVVTVISGLPQIQVDIAPTNAGVVVGGNVSFSASFVGTQPMSYVWELNGAPIVNNSRISGANNTTLVIDNAQLSDAGAYQLIASNSFGTNGTSIASLVILPTLSFDGGTGSGWASQFYSTGGWQGSNIVQLTGNSGSEDAAVWFDTPVYVGAFEASFIYSVPTGATGSADGTVFCIQNDPRGAKAIGGAGGSLGVGTGQVPNETFGGMISPSFEYEFNIYSGNGFGGVGVAFATGGAVANVTVPGNIVINSGDPIQTVITYANGLVTATLTDTNTLATYTMTTNINIPQAVGGNTAYVGFTAADGGSKSTQTVSDFQYVAYAPITASTTPGNVTLSWPSGLGAYVLQSSPILSTTNWSSVSATQSEVNGNIEVTIPTSGAAAQFYRLVLQLR